MTEILSTPRTATKRARSSRRARPAVLGAVLATGTLLLTAACSSSSSSSSSTTSPSTGGSGSTASASAQSSSLTAALQALEVNPAFMLPGPALDAKKLPASTPIVVIDNTPSVGPLEETSAGVMQAAQQARSPKLLNGGANNTASDDINLLEQAVNLHPKVVLQVGIITALETAGLQYAKAHGVPVIAVDDDAPVAARPGQGSGPLASGTSAQDYTAYGKVLAEYVAARGRKNASVGVITSADIVPSTAILDAFKSELAQLCPGCSGVHSER